MLLDLTRRPIMILAEQCLQSLVVRTFQTKDVSGQVQVKYETRGPPQGYRDRAATREVMEFIPPDASLKRGPITCHETRLNLSDAIRAYERANTTRWHLNVKDKPKLDLAAEPLEVATGAKDVVTDQLFVWRLAIFIQRHKELWLVTVRDVSGQMMQDLCTVATRDLDMTPNFKEDLPLQRLMKKVAGVPQTAWQHILDDD